MVVGAGVDGHRDHLLAQRKYEDRHPSRPVISNLWTTRPG
jgi:hypothetical protein